MNEFEEKGECLENEVIIKEMYRPPIDECVRYAKNWLHVKGGKLLPTALFLIGTSTQYLTFFGDVYIDPVILPGKILF